MLDVANDAHDLARNRFPVYFFLNRHTDGDVFSQRAFGRPEFFCGGLIDYDHLLCGEGIGIVEIATRSQWNSHRMKVTRRNLMSVGLRPVIRRHRAAIDCKGARAPRPAERKTCCKTGGFNSGKRS